jgi:hypothetical protein
MKQIPFLPFEKLPDESAEAIMERLGLETSSSIAAELARWRDAFFQIGLSRQDEARCRETQKLHDLLDDAIKVIDALKQPSGMKLAR